MPEKTEEKKRADRMRRQARHYFEKKHNFGYSKCGKCGCRICWDRRLAPGEKKATADHIIRIADGGTNHPSNLMELCMRCHQIKDGVHPKPKMCRFCNTPIDKKTNFNRIHTECQELEEFIKSNVVEQN